MPLTSTPWKREVLAGIKDSLGLGIAIFPLGMALGILVVQSELPNWVLPALQIGVFAGSVELLLVSMLAAATPILTIAVMVLAVNFRHVFYAFSFPLTRVRKGLPRAYSVYALVDEAYATYSLLPKDKLSSPRIVTGQLSMQLYWVLGGLLGFLIASNLSAPIIGFEFALPATFIVMALDAVRSKREIPSALLAGLSVTVAIFLFPENAMLAGLVVFALLLAVRYAFAARRLSHADEKADQDKDQDPDATPDRGDA